MADKQKKMDGDTFARSIATLVADAVDYQILLKDSRFLFESEAQ